MSINDRINEYEEQKKIQREEENRQRIQRKHAEERANKLKAYEVRREFLNYLTDDRIVDFFTYMGGSKIKIDDKFLTYNGVEFDSAIRFERFIYADNQIKNRMIELKEQNIKIKIKVEETIKNTNYPEAGYKNVFYLLFER